MPPLQHPPAVRPAALRRLQLPYPVTTVLERPVVASTLLALASWGLRRWLASRHDTHPTVQVQVLQVNILVDQRER